MPPRGLKALLKTTSPGKLVGGGKFKGYQATSQGRLCGSKLKGVTKLLHKRIYSNGILPLIARKADPRKGGHWKGKCGGQNRGTRVDAQVTRIVNAGASALKQIQHTYVLTKHVFAALKQRRLEPLLAQRVVLDQSRRVATAADLVCFDSRSNHLTIVELKCGYDHGRQAPAESVSGKICKMRSPLAKAPDCNLNRHLAQLAVTRELFVREKALLKKMKTLGVNADVHGLLLYAADKGVEFYDLDDWWKKRAPKIVAVL